MTVSPIGESHNEMLSPGDQTRLILNATLSTRQRGPRSHQRHDTNIVMRAVVQRVSRASVTVDATLTGKIANGLLVLLGVGQDDRESDAEYLADKIAGLRIFEDEQEKMNRSVLDAGGAVLAVSQFTLYGDVRRGKRPSFDAAARPERARELYEYFVSYIRSLGVPCETGVFQAMMQVELVNSGPVTILIDSKKEF